MRLFLRLLGLGFAACLALGVIAGAGVFHVLRTYGRDLPDYRQLAHYQPDIVTRFHAGDGRLLAEYAQEKRIFVPVEAIPARVREAFVAAEDNNFYHHFGVDPVSVARAAMDNLRNAGANRRPVGASTITQQVAKNFLLSNELSLTRKIKEAILAVRIEHAFTKDQILGLYLNEIYLGYGSYGVAAAALNYFDKSLDDLTPAEAAFLAGLPKAPSRYDPARNNAEAKARRDYVIGRMREDGYLTRAEADAALASPLVIRRRGTTEFVAARYFAEEARRRLAGALGEDALYKGGLSVRTTVNPTLDALARRALREGLSAYDRRARPWRGPLGRIDLARAGDAWPETLGRLDLGFDADPWRRAVVLNATAEGARVGFSNGSEAVMPAEGTAWAGSPEQVLARGDVVVVERTTPEDGGAARLELRRPPEVEGAVVALDPHTGRVLALAGGFSFERSPFNRATQAKRQPGSVFKPFIYLAGLEAGYTPSTIILDAPMIINPGPNQPPWRPSNFTNRFYGPRTFRFGVEKSINLMTVRLAQDVGMARVVDVARRFGIAGGLGTNLATALGSNEVDLLGLTSAYAMLVNGGRKIEPQFVDRVQDRYGRTIPIGRHPACPTACSAPAWNGGPPPALPDPRPRVEDPRIAYQLVNILTGVVERGTAVKAASLGVPLGGKTGTSNDSRDAWFVGFTPDLVVGVFVGFDRPRSLGKKETGASVALPIFTDIMRDVLRDAPPTPFRVPPGVSLVRVDPGTGAAPEWGSGDTILEAFLPGTEPGSTAQAVIRGDGAAAVPAGAIGPVPPGDGRSIRPPSASGGLY